MCDSRFSPIIVQLRPGEGRELDQGHPVSLWQNWNQNPGLFQVCYYWVFFVCLLVFNFTMVPEPFVIQSPLKYPEHYDTASL